AVARTSSSSGAVARGRGLRGGRGVDGARALRALGGGLHRGGAPRQVAVPACGRAAGARARGWGGGADGTGPGPGPPPRSVGEDEERRGDCGGGGVRSARDERRGTRVRRAVVRRPAGGSGSRGGRRRVSGAAGDGQSPRPAGGLAGGGGTGKRRGSLIRRPSSFKPRWWNW